jgi:hypothetical protein
VTEKAPAALLVVCWLGLALPLLAACGSPATPAAALPATQTAPAGAAGPTVSPTPAAVPPTSTPRGTPAALATSTPRPASPAAAVPVKPQVEARKVNSYRTTAGLVVIGELVNTGAGDAGGFQLAVSLLDANGATVGAAAAADWGSSLLTPGQFTVWRAVVQNEPEGWKDVRVQAQASAANSAARDLADPDIRVQGINFTVARGAAGYVTATGQVANTGAVAADAVCVTMGAYDAGGTLLAVEYGCSPLLPLPAGASAPFSINFYQLTQPPARYEVFLKGRRTAQ